MEWKELPAFFCGTTETAQDVITTMARLQEPGTKALPEHPLKSLVFFLKALEEPTEKPQGEPVPWVNIESFIYDFMLMSCETAHFCWLTRTALHEIYSVFPPLSVTGHKNGKELISLKKLGHDEGDWMTEKVILGWRLNEVSRRVALTLAKAALYRAKLQSLIVSKQQKQVKLKEYQKVIGKLWFAAIAILAGQGLFLLLNRAMWGNPRYVRIGLKTEIQKDLEDWLVLLDDVVRRPTHVFELCPCQGIWDYLGYCNACTSEAGGVWLPLDSTLASIL